GCTQDLMASTKEREGMTMRRTNMKPITELNAVSARKPILQSVLGALNEGRIAEAAAQFDDQFTFTDHALDLEFTDKSRLIEFFQKTRELSRTPWWKWILASNAEITSVLNGSLGQFRLCPIMDPRAF